MFEALRIPILATIRSIHPTTTSSSKLGTFVRPLKSQTSTVISLICWKSSQSVIVLVICLRTIRETGYCFPVSLQCQLTHLFNTDEVPSTLIVLYFLPGINIRALCSVILAILLTRNLSSFSFIPSFSKVFETVISDQLFVCRKRTSTQRPQKWVPISSSRQWSTHTRPTLLLGHTQ